MPLGRGRRSRSIRTGSPRIRSGSTAPCRTAPLLPQPRTPPSGARTAPGGRQLRSPAGPLRRPRTVDADAGSPAFPVLPRLPGIRIPAVGRAADDGLRSTGLRRAVHLPVAISRQRTRILGRPDEVHSAHDVILNIGMVLECNNLIRRKDGSPAVIE